MTIPLAILDSDRLYGAILTGCQSIKSAQQQLNDINVFPVADGDTGDNMASTALAIIRNTKKKPTIHALLSSVAEASMRGARGNSGIIFSQFFNALAETYHDKTTMDAHEFAAKTTEAFKKPPVYIEEASPAIGLHAGQGSIALAFRFEHHDS